MSRSERLACLDNLRTFLIFLVVLVHAGVVYESSGLMASFWIVDDPATSDVPGLVNLFLDILVMPSLFFVSGFFAPESLERSGWKRFLTARLRRLLIPWLVAVLTLMPLYKVIFLASRGWPQQHWTTYFHFSNGGLGMSWLWFLPVLFLFDAIYVLLRALRLPFDALTVPQAIVAAFATSVASSIVFADLGLLGWTKTPLVDFQNERLLPYLLSFLLGALCARRKVLEQGGRGVALLVAVSAVAWVPVTAYAVLVLNFIFRPGKPLISAAADGPLLWLSLHLSELALVYCTVATFRRACRGGSRLGAALRRVSYGVYIVHMVVLGPIAWSLLRLGVPALVKYPILAVTTYLVSGEIVWAYRLASARLGAGAGRWERSGNGGAVA